MPQILLTDIAVRSLNAPPKGQTTYWDSKMPGFGCRVFQGGQKTFIVMYGHRESRRRKVVGKYPIQNLKSAREHARKLLAKIALGIVEEKPKTAHITFSKACDQYLEAARKRIKQRTADDYERLLTLHFKFKGRKLIDLEKTDLQKCLNKLEHTPSEYRHAYASIRAFFNWAYREELIERNPVDRLQSPPRARTRDRVLDEGEFKELLQKALEFEWPYGAITALCALTGQRRGEIAMLQWDWLDSEARTITLPGEKVKNGCTHVFPYGKITEQLLKELPRFDQYVFSGQTDKCPIFNGWSKCKKRFDAQLEGVAHYTLHDLRRTFSTAHAKIGTPIHVTEKLLNHISGTVSGVAAVYNRHNYLEEMRIAMDKYDTYLSELINPC